MATTKKNVTVEEAAIETLDTMVEEKKTPVKRATKKTAAKAETSEETTAEATEAKVPAKKTTAKKSASKKAAEVKCNISVQFAGKSYSQEDLLKIAKDVWVYDLNRTAEELVNVELYVKPEDSSVYYVFNGTETGSFLI